MPLNRSSEKPYVGRDGVYFRMIDHTGKLITCSVSLSALRIFSETAPPVTAANPVLGLFNGARRHAEELASSLYDGGESHPRVEALPAYEPLVPSA